ncbi:hypothetical protein [Bradyrhizobium sp. 187]|uniref:hypothetical protein n=1 Tax=Bradyrhizobium sp. 187 TaxID=2782655 RepID=UPI001FFF44D0|nr:hypothetical protein [Bradyrhizobium sp. 187]
MGFRQPLAPETPPLGVDRLANIAGRTTVELPTKQSGLNEDAMAPRYGRFQSKLLEYRLLNVISRFDRFGEAIDNANSLEQLFAGID